MSATATLLNASMFKVGDRLSFLYHDKQREGTVEKVNHSHLVLREMTNEDKVYKGFAYAKMQSMTWLIA